MPFDHRMSPDGVWLQWLEDECRVIPNWLYALLALMWPILRLLYAKNEYVHPDHWYFTFTNVPANERGYMLDVFRTDNFVDIPLIKYNALPQVDDVPWGWRGK